MTLAGLVLVIGFCATPALARTPAGESAEAQPQAVVSTSPAAPTVSGTPGDELGPFDGNTAPEAPPLTRAATKQRIAEMSPLRWLAHYGVVSIGQLE